MYHSLGIENLSERKQSMLRTVQSLGSSAFTAFSGVEVSHQFNADSKAGWVIVTAASGFYALRNHHKNRTDGGPWWRKGWEPPETAPQPGPTGGLEEPHVTEEDAQNLIRGAEKLLEAVSEEPLLV